MASARRVAEVAAAVGGRAVGDAELVLTGLRALEAAGPQDLSFLARPDYRAAARSSAAGCVLCTAESDLPGRTVIVAENAHRALAVALSLFYPEQPREPGVHPHATVAPTARLGEGVHVGARAVVGEGAEVGAGTAVLAGASIGAGCVVGAGCVLHPGVVLYPGTRLGDGVLLHANAVIGSDGFGYAAGPSGHVKIPHVGTVVIEDDVEIGAGSCVDRAVLGETRIGAGTKIDNLVQVGHNVTVGAGSLLVAQSGIAGSTRLGRGCVLAGQAGVGGHLSLGDGARVAAKSAALADVPAGETVAGVPAVPRAEWLRVTAALRRLPAALRRMRALTSGGDGDDGHAGDDAPSDGAHRG